MINCNLIKPLKHPHFPTLIKPAKRFGSSMLDFNDNIHIMLKCLLSPETPVFD